MCLEETKEASLQYRAIPQCRFLQGQNFVRGSP